MCIKLICSCFVILALAAFSAQSFAGNNPLVKVAVHVQPHGMATCESMPELSGCGDVIHTHEGCGDIDVFPVFWGLTEYLAFQYSLVWPSEWGSCTYTSCSDLVIYSLDFYGDPETQDPGDVVSQTYFACQPGVYLEIPGFGWLSASTPGRVCLGGIPPWLDPGYGSTQPAVLDCSQSVDIAICISCAGVCGMMGDEPCNNPSSVEGSQWGKIKAIFK